MNAKIEEIVNATLPLEADPKDRYKLYKAIETLVKEEMEPVKKCREFQKQYFIRARKNDWTSGEEKNKAIAHAKTLEAAVDEKVEKYYPKSTQGTLL